MKTKRLIRSQKGFTLIEIIAVLVILGILAAVAIPKYIDMRKEAVDKAAGAAVTELNARERLTLAQWKLNDGSGPYPGINASAVAGNGNTVAGPVTAIGDDWNKNVAIKSGDIVDFQGKSVTFTRTPPGDLDNEPYSWTKKVE